MSIESYVIPGVIVVMLTFAVVLGSVAAWSRDTGPVSQRKRPTR